MTLRSNRKELGKEIQRLKDQMDILDPTSEEHQKVSAQYVEFLDRENEIKKRDQELLKIGAGLAGGLITVGVYRICLDTTSDPFFKEVWRIAMERFKKPF